MTPQWQDYIALLKKEVIPALGCTEPMSIALAASIAREMLGAIPDRIEVQISANLYKNGMGVGIPGSGMVGLDVAAALGAIAGRADGGLEVLKGITDENVQHAKVMLDRQCIAIDIADSPYVISVDLIAFSANSKARVMIQREHTGVVYKELGGEVLLDRRHEQDCINEEKSQPDPISICVESIVQFASEVELDAIEFMTEAVKLNSALAEEGLRHHYGLQIGATLFKQIQRHMLSDDLMIRAMRLASAASDARMDGAMLPAMSNSGSGNQGISATMPVVAAAEFLQVGEEKMLRAIVMSHLMAIYIKSFQNKLSALCAASTATMGSGAAITWLLGGDLKQIGYCINSMIGDISGIICDGAKTSCAMKVSTAAGAAIKASLMAVNNLSVTENEGIVAQSPDQSIRNLGQLSTQGMLEMDRQIIKIMRVKHHLS